MSSLKWQNNDKAFYQSDHPLICQKKVLNTYLQVNSEFSVKLNTVQTEKIEFESSTYIDIL